MGRIDITGINLIDFIKKVYELSNAQGLGFLHYEDKDLTDEEAKEILALGIECGGKCIVSMDYIKGRACKIHAFKDGDKLFIDSPWYDHSDEQLEQLLGAFDIQMPNEKEHSESCNCKKCSPDKIEDDDGMRGLAIMQGWAPKKCNLHGTLVMALKMGGEDPCAGCNQDRLKCGGRQKEGKLKYL